MKVKSDISEEIVWLALDQLKQDNLLENNNEFEINFGGLSRRQVIRKIGFASLVTLPLISSIIAPTSAMAQSGLRSLFASCSAPAQCQSVNRRSSRCCVSTSTGGLTFQTYIAPQDSCVSDGIIQCCSGLGSFLNPVGDGSFGLDVCRCV